jgi:transposase-like protein
MNCPKCGCTDAVKNGTMNQKQRYKCKQCNCNYTQSTTYRISLEKRIQAIKLYLEGVGFRGIERLTGISHNTVIQWVRQLASESEIDRLRPEIENKVVDVALDELWHFIQKKLKNAGSGLRGIDNKSVVLALN